MEKLDDPSTAHVAEEGNPNPNATWQDMLWYALQWSIVRFVTWAILFAAAWTALRYISYGDRDKFELWSDAKVWELFCVFSIAVAGADGSWWLYRRWVGYA